MIIKKLRVSKKLWQASYGPSMAACLNFVILLDMTTWILLDEENRFFLISSCFFLQGNAL